MLNVDLYKDHIKKINFEPQKKVPPILLTIWDKDEDDSEEFLGFCTIVNNIYYHNKPDYMQ